MPSNELLVFVKLMPSLYFVADTPATGDPGYGFLQPSK
jgi:hypothetical protein